MNFTVRLRNNFDLLCTSHLLASLFTHGRVRFVEDDFIESTCVLRIEVNSRKYLIDLSDHSNFLDDAGLAWCDLYLKRNTKTVGGKIVPFGLNFNARGHWSALRACLVARNLKRSARLLRTPSWMTFETFPHSRVENLVLLQTRLWEQADCVGDQGINDHRIQLVSSLKNAFGSRFRGGLIDTPQARKLAPSLISNGPSRQSDYIEWQKQCSVALYTRGLYDSIGFKLAEYLASSKCIVSEPIVNELPSPLQDGKHLRVFFSIEEAIEQCRELLAGTKQIYREAAWDYYQQHVRLCRDAMDQMLAVTLANDGCDDLKAMHCSTSDTGI